MKHHNEIRGIEDLEKRFTGNASENLSDLCELLRIESASQIKFTMSAFQVGNNKKVKVDEKTCDMAVILYALSYTFPTEEKDTNFLSFLFSSFHW
ncbi:MAG: hypothetical protein HGA61_04830 [Candidatus Moranbacteria bacterium]|nr:hypothetical protein [Candidatus Moranbacteria bacterium]